MSIGFMLPDKDDAIIWRGPKKNGVCKGWGVIKELPCAQKRTRAAASVRSTAGYLSFGPVAQCVVHALKGLAYRASPSRTR